MPLQVHHMFVGPSYKQTTPLSKKSGASRDLESLRLGCKCPHLATAFWSMLQWRTKKLGTVMENLPSTSLTYQIIRCNIICTTLTTWIPRMALPSPLQTILGWRYTFRTGLSVQGLHKLQHCLGARGKRGGIKANRVNWPESFVPHCSWPFRCRFWCCLTWHLEKKTNECCSVFFLTLVIFCGLNCRTAMVSPYMELRTVSVCQ